MDLERFFGEGGALSGALNGYAPRPAQIQFARAVAETLGRGGVLLAEAGTGTGKTLAYLVPTVLAGKKTVVSTATKTLQAQILDKDVPLLSRALGSPVSATLLKGRENYLCLRRFEQFRSQPLFRFTADAAHYAVFAAWAGATPTGDRAELLGVPEGFAPWRDVCSTAETCWGGRCPREEMCHYLRHRRAAQKAQVVVVNHHLFFADLAVRASSGAEVLPRYAAVVFDEAHHVESVATQYFGTRVSSHRITDLLQDADRLAAPSRDLANRWGNRVAAVAQRSEALWKVFPRVGTPTRLKGSPPGDLVPRLGELREALDRWGDCLAPHEAESQDVENLARRVRELGRDLAVFSTAPEPGEVRWLETRGRGVFLHAAPVEVGPTLEQGLFGGHLPVILTSATLRVGGTFDYVAGRLGIRGPRREIAVDSPFDYGQQGLLYVPRGLPEPNDSGFAAAAAGEIRSILEASRGRAFCLFTSHRVLQAVAAVLRTCVTYRLLIQGEGPRESLLRQFQEDIHSVLLGAQAFWEGVDVPGQALSAVVIDRIPFASPADPLVEARVETLRSRGEQPFRSYQLPAAAMALRQGVGRLLRRIEDRGIVVILDRRYLESSYGGYLQDSLPPLPVTRDLGAVYDFFSKKAPT
ncbi:MAG: ATP-dependent DNA helicase [Deltaproteobacteria bacterium]|nr:ATP-dependent DNA helicase [Deltaproteobacteria bacterium]